MTSDDSSGDCILGSFINSLIFYHLLFILNQSDPFWTGTVYLPIRLLTIPQANEETNAKTIE
jgi:hypothetical protein